MSTRSVSYTKRLVQPRRLPRPISNIPPSKEASWILQSTMTLLATVQYIQGPFGPERARLWTDGISFADSLILRCCSERDVVVEET